LLPVNSASLIVSPHTTHILNQHDRRSALVHISGALTACWQLALWRKFPIEDSKVNSWRSARHGIKADRKRKLKLKIINAWIQKQQSRFAFGCWCICWELPAFDNSPPGGTRLD